MPRGYISLEALRLAEGVGAGESTSGPKPSVPTDLSPSFFFQKCIIPDLVSFIYSYLHPCMSKPQRLLSQRGVLCLCRARAVYM